MATRYALLFSAMAIKLLERQLNANSEGRINSNWRRVSPDGLQRSFQPRRVNSLTR